MATQHSFPEVETYLGFAALQRQQHCQEILGAIDAFEIPKKKKFASADVQTLMEELKAGLFIKIKQVLEKDAQATAGMLANTLAQQDGRNDRGHVHFAPSPGEASAKAGHGREERIAARCALKDIQQHHGSLLKRIEQFREHLQHDDQKG